MKLPAARLVDEPLGRELGAVSSGRTAQVELLRGIKAELRRSFNPSALS